MNIALHQRALESPNEKTDKGAKRLYYKKVIETEVLKYLNTSTLANTTQDLYFYFLRMFFLWAYDNKYDPSKADASMVAEWFRSRPAWSNSTKHNAAAALREFYRWKHGEGHPVSQVKVKRLDAGPQRTLDSQELSDLLAGINTNTEKGIRDLAIITMMADTGMRASEIAHTELRHLDMLHRSLNVVVKGGGWARKMFFEYTASCLENWLAIRSKVAAPTCKTVFTSVGGKKPGQTMTRYGIRSLVVSAATDAGLSRLTPHAMRRTFATIATENGAPSRVVQVAGGWRSIRMVERYTQALKADALHPYSPINSVMGFVNESK